MTGIVCYDSDGQILNHYTQWDKNQKLIVRGADKSSAPQFHFSNNSIKKAIVTSSVIRSDGITANVPDVLLRTAEPLIVNLCYNDGNTVRTKHSFRIPIYPKKEPENYLYNDGDGGIVMDNANIVVDDQSPEYNSVLWFDTSAMK